MQAVTVKSDSHEKSKEAMLSLLASYKYLVSQLPEEDELRGLICSHLNKFALAETVSEN